VLKTGQSRPVIHHEQEQAKKVRFLKVSAGKANRLANTPDHPVSNVDTPRLSE
jgi:hypothetical protein